MAIHFELNGTRQEVEPREGESLLSLLRDRLGLSSPKNGCEPQGQCGCCLALIDGQPKTTCTIPAQRADGKAIVTLEGVPEEERRLLARSFVAAAGLQCGFCIPGIVLRTHHLLAQSPDPSREEIAKALDVHLCRCTGYLKLFEAVELAARALRGEVDPQPLAAGGVGEAVARHQGEALALGERPYVDDLRREGMLFGAVHLSAHARATVRAIDTRAAEAMEGVVRVATAADVPGERFHGLLHQDWPGFVAVGETTRCVGDVLAVVAARDPQTARRAAAAIAVDYEVHPPVVDVHEAMRPDAPRVNDRHPGNLLSISKIVLGDAEAALRGSAHRVEGTWRTQRIEHAFLEPEAAFAEPREDGTLYLATQGQGIFDDRRQVAAFLGVPEAEVFVELFPNGGAFGGKEDLSIQPQTALLARLTGRPVKLTLTREQSIRMHPKRHPIELRYEAGCDAEGRLTAVRARLIGDTGAYASVGEKVLRRAAGHACGPYRVPTLDVEAAAVMTNNPPCGAMRGFGVNQASFAMEGVLDALAEAAGLDPFELRRRNVVEVGDTLTSGQRLEKSVGIGECLERLRPAYEAARAAGKAVGVACGIKNSGIGNGAVEHGRTRLRVEADGTVALYNGFTEMGQGLSTLLQQFAAEVTGLPSSRFVPRTDTSFELGCGQTTGSRGTLLSGRAVIAAAEQLRDDLAAGATLESLAGKTYRGEIEITDTHPLGKKVERPKTHTTYGFAAQLVILDAEGRLEKVVAAHDVGRVVNPDLCVGQIQGAVHMGLGHALSEELPCVDGMPIATRLREIGVLRARDMPEVEVHLVEAHEPEGPFGAKGVGEIGLVPTAGAVAAALFAFDGVRRRTLPMKDSPAGRAITVGRIRARIPREEWR
ncbi:MAG: selenium-dependent xanthine dehydrogenase [Deltaproteobacteria bacterium]|nr:selenium-dependent xanthine dehydrogenase [Deltaproteobacteria bacterium]